MKSFNAIVLIHLLALASVRNFNLTDIKAASDNNRIVNGLDAAIGQFPHQVSLRAKQNNRHFCGGTILSSRWIVTAAHCSFLNMDVVAVAGSIELNRGGRAYDIASIVPHPRYVPGSFPYDIALWQTSEDIAFGEAVQPAILPSYDTPADAALIVSGWGRTRFPPPPGSDAIPNHLQYLSTKSLSVHGCIKAFRNLPDVLAGNDFHRLVCVLKRGSGTCHGDSGGPLITGDRVVVGVVSWGIPCARGYPDGFTRVFSFLDFIKQVMSIFNN